jgi:hypothetical protein
LVSYLLWAGARLPKNPKAQGPQLTITIEPPIAANEQNVLTILIWRILNARNLGSYILPTLFAGKGANRSRAN